MTKRAGLSFFVCACILLPLQSCRGRDASAGDAQIGSLDLKYTDIVLGESATDLEASIIFVSHRTDMASSDYKGRGWQDYIADFNRLYPGIQVSVEALSDYSSLAAALLEQGDWDIMMIPVMERQQYSRYFVSFGTVEDLSRTLRFADQFAYGGRVYGLASAGNVQGIVYNKRVFREAGVTELPRTPDEFLSALRKVRQRTRAVPLYTNYADGWPLNQWDYYIGSTATGDGGYLNYTLVHQKNPFSDPGDGSGAYNVYRILYEAVSGGLTESDFTATDWEGCKGMLNRGDIAAMALGSWAVAQVQVAGPNPGDVGYMPFPMLVDGVQIASALPDNNYGINVRSEGVKKLAAMIFVKYLVEGSGFQYNEGEIPILLSDTDFADLYEAFDGIEMMVDEVPPVGEEDLLSKLNADSGLGISQDGSGKLRQLIEHAAKHDAGYQQIVEEWNERWSRAQEKNGVSLK